MRKAHAMLCVSRESSPEGLCVCHRLSAPQSPTYTARHVARICNNSLCTQQADIQTAYLSPKLSPLEQQAADPKGTSRLLSILGCFLGSLRSPALYLFCNTSEVPFCRPLAHRGLLPDEHLCSTKEQGCPSLCWACPPGTPLGRDFHSLSYVSTCPRLLTSQLA